MKNETQFPYFPLVRAFEYEGGYILYDAKSHFACYVSSDAWKLMEKFLNGKSITDCGFESNFLRCLILLQERGVFLPGAFEETYSTDKIMLREAIQHFNENVMYRRFALEVTRECNFRCRYCSFTREFGARCHKPDMMHHETAQKAIDFYYNRVSSLFVRENEITRTRILDLVPPTLSWYGGEPLLNFDLVKFSADYYINKNWNQIGISHDQVHCAMTTNFSLLTDEIIEFLVAYSVKLKVSLDGPKEDNDTMRVYADGQGTFDVVYNNLRRLYKVHPKYFIENVRFSPVLEPNYNLLRVKKFFSQFVKEFDLDPQLFRYSPSWVDYRDLIVPPEPEITEDNQKNFEDKDLYSHSFSCLTCEELHDLSQSDFQIRNDLDSLLDCRKISFDSPQGSNRILSMLTCPMGFDALMVSVDGQFHMCERTDCSLPIGDVKNGYNFDAISHAYADFHETFNCESCKNCWAIKFCTTCAALLLLHKRFHHPNETYCQTLRNNTEIKLIKYFNETAANSQLIQYLDKRLSERIGSVDISVLRKIGKTSEDLETVVSK